MRVALLLLAGSLGCFYDSSWGHEKTAQQHNAEAARPASFKSESSGAMPAKAAHVFKMRVWATPQYISQTLDWQHDFKEVVETANEILLKSADTRIELAGMSSWPAGEENLEKALTALAAHDKAEDVEWVVGLVSGFATFTTSFHDLGAARYLSRYMVLRAASDFTEHAAAEAAFTKLGTEERMRLLAERKRHRSVATFVHEVGHTLGAVHDTDREGLMYPGYSKVMRAFGPDVSKVLAIGVAHRNDPSQHPLAKDLLAYYEANTTPWVAKERESTIAQLKAFVGPAPVAPIAAAPVVAFKEPPAELKDPDRATWSRAVELFRAAKWKDSWDAGLPLFTAYPKVLPVQDLRCQVAMKIGFEWQRTKTECAPLMQLSTGK